MIADCGLRIGLRSLVLVSGKTGSKAQTQIPKAKTEDQRPIRIPLSFDTSFQVGIIGPLRSRRLAVQDATKTGRIMRIELDKLEELGGSFAHSYSPEELSLEDQSAILRRP